jgi:hypothetical protein
MLHAGHLLPQALEDAGLLPGEEAASKLCLPAIQSVKGELHLRRFGNDSQTHQLRNVSHIVLGVANKRLR